MLEWKALKPAKHTRNCRTPRPTKVLVPLSCPIELQDISNGSTKGDKCNLDNSQHPIDIKSGLSLEDTVRCRAKPIQPSDSRRLNKNSPPMSEHQFLGTYRIPRIKGRKEKQAALYCSTRVYALQKIQTISNHGARKQEERRTRRGKSTIFFLGPTICHSDPAYMWLCVTKVLRKKTDPIYHCNANLGSRIPTSEKGNRSPTSDSN
ncbi:hypothetical protein Bca101_010405 [Brassica carinata]